MFDAVKVLGSLLEQGGAGSQQSRLQQAIQQAGGPGGLDKILAQLGAPGGTGGLHDMLGGLLTKASAAANSAATQASAAVNQQGGLGEILGNLAGMAKNAATTTRDEASKNNPVAVGGLGALAGALLGGGKGAIGGGLMAVLGSMAYAAVQRAEAAAAPADAPAPAIPAALPGYHDDAAVQRKAQLLLRAMIQAAKADGQIDGREIQRITGKLMEDGGNNAARTFVLQEMAGAVDIAALTKDVATPQDAAEIYAASLLAIDVDTDAEKAYLGKLATALRLSPDAVAHIHDAIGAKA